MTSGSCTNVRAILPDRVIDDATVVWEDGIIVDVGRGAPPPGAIDGWGAYCLPGLIDTHSDALEKEVNPRPRAEFPLGFALRSLEGRLATAGITTAYTGVGFQDGFGRSIELAKRLCGLLHERQTDAASPVAHRILHRLDARSPDGLDVIETFLAPGATGELVSIEDHTPGQGQFRNPATLRDYYRGSEGCLRDEEADAQIRQLTQARGELLVHAAANRSRLASMAASGRIRLLAHDLEDPEEVGAAAEIGASVAEFPLTVDAARAARDHGMVVTMGAPNVVRGGSLSGNAATTEVVAAGLCDALSSDYQPATMLAAAFSIAESGLLGLPQAVALVTSGPATVAGVADRGRLQPGARADLVLVDLDRGWPVVRERVLAGRVPRSSAVPVPA